MRFRTSALAGALAGAVLLPASARAVDFSVPAGETSFEFLKLSLSPKSIGMGGSGAGLADEFGLAEVNPAAAARDTGALILGQDYPPGEFGATGSHVDWSLPWAGKRITLQARYLGYDHIPGFDNAHNATTSYDAYTLKIQAGLAGDALGFAYGVSAAFAQNNVADATYGAGLLNAGLWHELPYGFSAGASLVNADFWTGTTQQGQKVIPPTALQAGLAYARDVGKDMRVTAALDARKRNDEDLVFPAGAEFAWKNALFLRAGYPLGDPDNTLDLGLGLRWTRYGFNYAYRGNSALSGGHSFTLEIRE